MAIQTGNMAQWVKGFAVNLDAEFDSWNPHDGGQGFLTLTSKYVSHVRVHTHNQ